MEMRNLNVVVADRRFPDRSDPFGDTVRKHGGKIRYEKCTSESDVIERCADAEILVVAKAPITPRVASELDEVELILRMGTGYDNINLKAATENGILVSNTPGYSEHEVATHAITLMLTCARNVVYSNRDMVEASGWGERPYINRMYGGTYGIIGFGLIGRATIAKAKGLDMDVVAFDPYVQADVFDAFEVEKAPFDTVLQTADCISIHAPLTAETHHMFSTKEFVKMKNDAILVNTARGPIVDEQALVEAIESGEIWGAGLDVFEREPPLDSPVLKNDRIVCTPHNAGLCTEVVEKNIEIVCQKLRKALIGEHLESIVNPEVLQYSEEQLNPEYDEWLERD